MKARSASIRAVVGTWVLLPCGTPSQAATVLVEVAVKDDQYTTSSKQQTSIPVDASSRVDVANRYQLAITPALMDEAGTVRIEISVRDTQTERVFKFFTTTTFGKAVPLVRSKANEPVIELVVWSR